MTGRLRKLPLRALGLAATALLAPGPAAAATKQGTIAGELRGLGPSAPASAQRVTIQAIDASSGRVAATEHRAGSTRYALRVPPGYYVLVAEVADAKTRKLRRTHSRLSRVRAGRRTTQHLRLTRGSAAAATSGDARPPAGFHAAETRTAGRERLAGSAGRTKLFGISPSSVVTFGRLRIPLDFHIASALLDSDCSGTDFRVRELDPYVLRMLRREIRLHNSGLVDPSTRIKPNWAEHRYEVVASGRVVDGVASMEARIFDRRAAWDRQAGKVIGPIYASGPARSLSQLGRVERLLGQRVAETACLPETWHATTSGTYTDTFLDNELVYEFSANYRLSPGVGQHLSGRWRVPYDTYEERGVMEVKVSGMLGRCAVNGSGAVDAHMELAIDGRDDGGYEYELRFGPGAADGRPSNTEIPATYQCPDDDGPRAEYHDVSFGGLGESGVRAYESDSPGLTGSDVEERPDYGRLDWQWSLTPAG